ncbi:hypothetical protein PR048_002279 [Dryococelus australis]|uniref:Uncharacterized protein n=1 Tax=Dryococelus australis TaxID=614101 RepID=A0ABQ9IM88_9NEOP|nr:hypothetical protein PR048_002279 [Dryococelus australis]
MNTYILNKHLSGIRPCKCTYGIVQAGRNTLDTDSLSEEYIVSDVLKTAGMFTEVENNREIEDSHCLPHTQPQPFDKTEISEECNEDGLRYLAG